MRVGQIAPWAAALAMASLALAGCGSKSATTTSPQGSAATSNGSSFYQGKTLSVIVPYGSGGGYDQWARLMAPYFKKYLGLAKVEIINKPGGGGVVGTNLIYTAKADGLTIGDTNAGGDVFDQMAHKSGVIADFTKVSWIGQPDNDPHGLSVLATAPYQTFADLLKLRGGKTYLRALATGVGSSDYNAELVTLNTFQIPYQIIASYKGSTAEKAGFLRGDGQALSVSISDIAPLVTAGKARTLVVDTEQPFSKDPTVPTILAEGKQAGLSQTKMNILKGLAGVMQLGHAFMGPPKIPASRLQALQNAFKKTLSDPNFLAQAKKAGLYTGYASPSQIQGWVQTGLTNAKEFKSVLIDHSQ